MAADPQHKLDCNEICLHKAKTAAYKHAQDRVAPSSCGLQTVKQSFTQQGIRAYGKEPMETSNSGPVYQIFNSVGHSVAGSEA